MKTTPDILQRFLAVVEHLKTNGVALTRKSLAEKLGYNPAVLSMILTGKQGFSMRFIKALQNLDIRISEDWLLTGKGKMLEDNEVYELGERLMPRSMPDKEYMEKVVGEMIKVIARQMAVIEELRDDNEDLSKRLAAVENSVQKLSRRLQK
ncbi:MAG: helix-turn-helix domain-containing protein [Muribaculaceae bacterium]